MNREMTIHIASRRTNLKTIQKKYPSAEIIDVTSRSPTKMIALSPFYPHGGIPIPFSHGHESMSVEGIWQGLKVFEFADVDPASFENSKMKNMKRSVRKYGKPLGHRKGLHGVQLLGYIEARLEIFLPTYRWVLENKVHPLIEELRNLSMERTLVLLDFETNEDVWDASTPLSHAYLVKKFIEGEYPQRTGSRAEF